jgi:hypothetical protein
LRPGSTFGFGFGAFLVSRLPLSLLPMKPNITQMAGQSEMLPFPEKENIIMNKPTTPAENTFTLGKESATPGVKIGRDQLLGKYWELANLNPNTTKGSIAGQLKALDSLCEELRLTAADKSKTPMKNLPSPQIYRPAWMTGPQRTN